MRDVSQLVRLLLCKSVYTITYCLLASLLFRCSAVRCRNAKLKLEKYSSLGQNIFIFVSKFHGSFHNGVLVCCVPLTLDVIACAHDFQIHIYTAPYSHKSFPINVEHTLITFNVGVEFSSRIASKYFTWCFLLRVDSQQPYKSSQISINDSSCSVQIIPEKSAK